jgi:LytS/YehU family sensor histidine kinase
VTCAWAAIYTGAQWYRRYRQAQLRDMQTQLSLRDAELRALQAQVNPHFLFNSLNTIRGTVRENPEQAEHMITSLSSLFRRSLRPVSARMIPLSEEMAAVSDYLDLESARFEERLQVRLEVSPEARPCPVPAMLVQTLVENAINHGIAKLPRGGIVRIRGAVEKKALVLVVENTGKLQEPNGNGAHTGLANSRERLRLLCGSDATLSLADDEGTVRVTVVIPQVP